MLATAICTMVAGIRPSTPRDETSERSGPFHFPSFVKLILRSFQRFWSRPASRLRVLLTALSWIPSLAPAQPPWLRVISAGIIWQWIVPGNIVRLPEEDCDQKREGAQLHLNCGAGQSATRRTGAIGECDRAGILLSTCSGHPVVASRGGFPFASVCLTSIARHSTQTRHMLFLAN